MFTTYSGSTELEYFVKPAISANRIVQLSKTSVKLSVVVISVEKNLPIMCYGNRYYKI